MHPILIQTKYFTLNTLWIFIITSLIGGMYMFIKYSVKNGLKIQFISQHSWQLIFYTLLGARIASIITNYQSYFYEFSSTAFFRLFHLWDKGLSFWGGALGFLIYLNHICKREKQDIFKWLDSLIPPMLFAMAIVHLGNFFEGANYGTETSLPWGVNFESPSIRYTVPIHPVQIYATLYTTALASYLMHLQKTPKIQKLKKSGFIALTGIAAYNTLRFLEEFIRGDDAIMIFSIRLSQINALVIAILAGIILYLRYNKPKRKTKK